MLNDLVDSFFLALFIGLGFGNKRLFVFNFDLSDKSFMINF